MPPTGEQFAIADADYRAVITETGATLRKFTFQGRDLVLPFDEDVLPTAGSGQLLAPWPNRVRDGRYVFDGATYQLALSEPARHNASHGLVRWLAWQPVEVTPSRLVMGVRLAAQSGYPWSLDLRVTYELGPEGLQVTQSARNLATTAAPYASGAHPYLVADHGPVDGWDFAQPGETFLRVDPDRKLPVGRGPVDELGIDEPDPLGSLTLDHAVTDLHRDAQGRAVVRLLSGQGRGPGVELWVDERHRWLQFFTGEGTPHARRAVAVEPMTAPPDTFNSGDDLVVLEPGATFAATWGIRAVQ